MFPTYVGEGGNRQQKIFRYMAVGAVILGVAARFLIELRYLSTPITNPAFDHRATYIVSLAIAFLATAYWLGHLLEFLRVRVWQTVRFVLSEFGNDD